MSPAAALSTRGFRGLRAQTVANPHGVKLVPAAQESLGAFFIGLADNCAHSSTRHRTCCLVAWKQPLTFAVIVAHESATCIASPIIIDDSVPAKPLVGTEFALIIRSASLEPLSLRAIVGAGEEGEGADCDHLEHMSHGAYDTS